MCFQKVPVLASRAFSSSARKLKNRVPEAQKLFQEDNGLPVHLKGGTQDVLLYRITMTLTMAVLRLVYREPATLCGGFSPPPCLRRKHRDT
uniref:Cytochrome c oxidase subunit 7A1, mitochondrial n=1 Tax=Lates calcarifer TaxID=8187 RepID=A0A4W6FJ96_LATCA